MSSFMMWVPATITVTVFMAQAVATYNDNDIGINDVVRLALPKSLILNGLFYLVLASGISGCLVNPQPEATVTEPATCPLVLDTTVTGGIGADDLSGMDMPCEFDSIH